MKTRSKNIILWIAIVLCLVTCIFVFAADFLKLDVNIIKHHEVQLKNFNIKFYGDIDSSRIVKIYEGSVRRASVELSVDTALFDEANLFDPYLEDLNGDGHLDLLIPHSKDASSSFRYAALIWDNDTSMFIAAKALSDIANVKVDTQNESVKSTMFIHTVVVPEQTYAPEVFEERRSLTEYKMVDGEFVAFREVALTYYSETNVYCYSQYDYDASSGELAYTDEKWITSKEAENIILK